MLLSLNTVQLRTQVSMGGQLVTEKMVLGGGMAVEQAQGLSFHVYADGVQRGTEAFPDGQRPPDSTRQPVQLVHRTPDDRAQEDLVVLPGFVRRTQ